MEQYFGSLLGIQKSEEALCVLLSESALRPKGFIDFRTDFAVVEIIVDVQQIFKW